MKKVIVINGPNINMLGSREPQIYGDISIDQLETLLKSEGKRIGIQVDTYQTNHEGNIIDYIHNAENGYDCIILNAGALTHYSIAIRDAISAVKVPVIEVHLSNIFAREKFRKNSVIAPVCRGHISGFGISSYIIALNSTLLL